MYLTYGANQNYRHKANELTCQSFGKEFAMSAPLHKNPIKLHSFSLFKALNSTTLPTNLYMNYEKDNRT